MKSDILEYLWRRFPAHCLILTDPLMLRAIGFGISRADAHGFSKPEEAAAWLVLMVYLGSRFDEDPLYPWVAGALERTRSLSRSQAMHALYDELNRNTNPVLGGKSVLYRQALARIGKLKFEMVLAAGEGDLDQSLLKSIETTWPARYTSLPAETRVYLLDRSREWVRKYGLLPGAGAIECLLAMVMFGSHVDRDPLLPWGEAVFTDAAMSDPLGKTQQVHETMQSSIARFAAIDRLRAVGRE